MNTHVMERVYRLLYQTILTDGLPLTVEEIAMRQRLNPTTVERALHDLERQGRITRHPERPRSTRLPEIEHRWALEDQVVQELDQFTRQHRRPPLVSELARQLGYAPQRMADILAALDVSVSLRDAA
jgi:DNA-binding transcriptional regulator YhcF (GntR family)